jgi:Zn finger protein HypA/HybF involved in hydrogenase expression
MLLSLKNPVEEVANMGKCREGQSEVPFAEASHKCGKCGARTAKPTHVCKPEPIERSATAPPQK